MLFKLKNERRECDAKVMAPSTDKEIVPKTKSTLQLIVQDFLRVVTDIHCLEEAATCEDHNLQDLPLVELDPVVLMTAVARRDQANNPRQRCAPEGNERQCN